MSEVTRLDSESGLYTQQMLEILLEREVGRSKRYANPLALIYLALRLPINPIREIRETARLVAANALQTGVREVDMPGHYQGNYLVALPETQYEGARKVAERLISRIHGDHATRENISFTLAACAGVAAHPGGQSISREELLSQAATALWEAERRGSQNLVLFSEMSDPAAG